MTPCEEPDFEFEPDIDSDPDDEEPWWDDADESEGDEDE